MSRRRRKSKRSKSLREVRFDETSVPAGGSYMGHHLGRFARNLFRPVDAAILVFFRIAFNSAMLWEVWWYWHYGWITKDFIAPHFHFTYFGFDWVRPWPGQGMYLHFAALGLLAFFLIVGFLYRLSATLFFFGFTYVFLIDASFYLNHFYLICLLSFVQIIIPAHRICSVDAWLWPKLHSPTAPAWTLWLLRAQIGIPYFYGGLAKINADWLRGEPMGMMLTTALQRWGIDEGLFTGRPLVFAFAYGGLLFDLLIVPALLWPRTRLLAYGLAVGFHLTNAILFDIGVFPWLMIAATLVFFPPTWPRRLLRRPQLTCSPGSISPAKWQSATCAFLAIYLSFQLLLPLRHYLYPGDVSWTEQGHHFSWHMKLRVKNVALPEFWLPDGSTGERRPIVSYTYLTPRQTKWMAGHPDKLQQFSKFLAGKLRELGFPNPEVHVGTSVSLNGRRPQPIVDPTVDLASQPRTLRHDAWIMPLTEPLRKVPWDWEAVPIESWGDLH